MPLHDYATRHSYTVADKYFDTVDQIEFNSSFNKKTEHEPTLSLHRSDHLSVLKSDRVLHCYGQHACRCGVGNKAVLQESTRFPIAILSFNRPHYLEDVLYSLPAQTVPVRSAHVFFFQDGYLSSTGRDLTDPKLLERCVELFEKRFPGSRTFLSKENLGVARNFARAEDYLRPVASESRLLF